MKKDPNKQIRSLTESVNNLYNKKSLTEQVGQTDQYGWNHLADIVSNWGQSVGHGEVWDSPPPNGVSGIEDILWLLDHWGEYITSLEQPTQPSMQQTQPTVSANQPQLTQRPYKPRFGRREH